MDYQYIYLFLDIEFGLCTETRHHILKQAIIIIFGMWVCLVFHQAYIQQQCCAMFMTMPIITYMYCLYHVHFTQLLIFLSNRVKLAVHRDTKEYVAVKIIHLDGKNGLTPDCLKKEVMITRNYLIPKPGCGNEAWRCVYFLYFRYV